MYYIALLHKDNFNFFRQIADELTTKSSYSIWIDLDDLENENLFMFGDGVLSTQTNTQWVDNEPNNGERNGEDCGMLWKEKQFLVNDAQCSNQYKALCVV